MGLSVSNFTIENNSGRLVREDIDDCFKALQGQSAETTDLADTQCVAGMTFLNSNSNIWKIRNSNNSGFTDIGHIDQDNLGLLPRSGGTMTGQFLADDSSSASSPAISFDTDTDMGLFRNSANVMGFSSGGTEQMIFNASGITLRERNEIRFGDADSSNYIGLKSPATIGSSFTLSLPTADGSSGQFLKTDGSGNLSFATVSQTVTVGTTSISTGGSATTISGLSSVTSTNVNSTTTKATTIQTNATNRVAPVFQNSSGTEIGRICNTFVNFNGQGTVSIRDDLNVTSITDLGTGFYRVNFTTNMADVNYTAIVSGDMRSPNGRSTSHDCNDYLVSSMRISCEDVNSQYGQGRADVKVVTVAIFGNT